ncbi:MAG: ribonuclease HI [Crocinitomicaceae bacterium]|nr:ribonuclease HI [Crocinitomicaceae bacterium]
MTKQIEIFTDGAAKGNPGNGGYGAILRFGGKEKELSQGFRKTTNNRMELLAVVVALESLKTNQYPVVVYSDSKYVVDAVTQNWVLGWVKKNFKGKKNKDLWLRYLAVAKNFQIQFVWVKGHNNHPENERCDRLAVAAAESNQLLIDEEYERIEQEGDQELFD